MKRLYLLVCLTLLVEEKSYAELSPVTQECVYSAAKYYNVPVALVVNILNVENGRVGKSLFNKNGTRDLGPMCINSIHLPYLSRFGISEAILRDNGCVNIYVGTWFLHKNIKEYPL